jgi:hypothetical protein
LVPESVTGLGNLKGFCELANDFPAAFDSRMPVYLRSGLGNRKDF